MTSSLATLYGFQRWQRRTFVIAWLSYASFYLCRVNLAVALPAIQDSFRWSSRTVGWIGGVFLWVYALGQLLNGTFGQKADARWFVGTGMLVSAACNVAFGALSWPWAMVLIWGINGWAQSMGWGAIMKTIAAWFGSRRRGRITALFSPCFVAGHLAAWAVGGWLVSRWGWRYAFWLPAIPFALMAGAWLIGIRSTPEAAGFVSPNGSNDFSKMTLGGILRALLTDTRLRSAAMTCVFASMIKDGLTLWAPTMLVDRLDLPVGTAALAASVLPLLGLGGSLLAGWASDRYFHSHESPGIILMSVVIALAMVGFRASGSGSTHDTIIAIALLGVCGLAVSGVNALLLTSVPLSFGDGGHVAAVAGFLDFAAYLGGGISGVVVGQLLDGPGWNGVFSYWLVATLAAVGGALLLGRRTQATSLPH